MAHSKAKLKSNDFKASICFKPFLIENMSDKFLPIRICYRFQSDKFVLALFQIEVIILWI